MEDNGKPAKIVEMDEKDYEYWSNQFSVSVDEVKRAIEKVGNSTDELEKYFKK